MQKPSVEEITNYLTSEKNYNDFSAMGFADQFWNFYESKGWLVGRSPMKSWKAAIRTWELNKKNNGTHQQTPTSGKQAGAYELLERARQNHASRGTGNNQS